MTTAVAAAGGGGRRTSRKNRKASLTHRMLMKDVDNNKGDRDNRQKEENRHMKSNLIQSLR